MSKRSVADFEGDLGIDPDNLEGMTFGPTFNDNNFNSAQTTQVIALAVELETVGD